MLKKLLLLCLLAASEYALGQAADQATKNPKKIDSLAFTKMSGDNKQNFWGTLGILGSFATQTGNTIAFQPTLYSLAELTNKQLEKAPEFRREAFLRAFQLNLGIDPGQTTIFSYDSAQLGFTIAIHNNKYLRPKDYDKLINLPAYDAVFSIKQVLTACLADSAYDANFRDIRALLKKSAITKADLQNIPDAIIKLIIDSLKIKPDNAPIDHLKDVILQDYNATGTIFKAKINELAHKGLLTATYNSIYDFIHGQWQEFDFTPVNWLVYPFKSHDAEGNFTKGGPAVNLSGTYTVGDDTSRKTFNLNREVYKASAGINFVIMKGHTDQPFIEIKPTADYQYIQSGKYAKETYTTVKPSVTLRLDISSNFSIPITIKYDKSQPKNLFGFLSIQYSTSKKGS